MKSTEKGNSDLRINASIQVLSSVPVIVHNALTIFMTKVVGRPTCIIGFTSPVYPGLGGRNAVSVVMLE